MIIIQFTYLMFKSSWAWSLLQWYSVLHHNTGCDISCIKQFYKLYLGLVDIDIYIKKSVSFVYLIKY